MNPTSSPTRLRGRHLVASFAGGCLLGPLCCLGLVFGAVFLGALTSGARAAGGAASSDSAVSLADRRAELAALPAGDAQAGEQVFNGEGGCQACHALAAGERRVGPSLAGVADRAAALAPDYSVDLYLYESIVAPSARVASGFPDGVMPGSFQQRLTPQQLADLIAFLRGQ